MVRMSAVMKCNLITACIIAGINLILNASIAYEAISKVEDYETYGEKIANATGNFDPESEWFTTISAEYQSLSAFDKENVYCDVEAILEDPSAHFDDGVGLAYLLVMAFFVTGAAIILISCMACCKRCDPFYGVDVADIGPEDPEDKMSKAVVLKSHKPQTPAEMAAADLSAFRYNTVALFFMTGPALGMYWLLVESRSATNGLDCQALFHDCGKSGDCTMDDMMTSIALNSSMIKLIISYPLIACGWFFGLFSLTYIMFMGVYMSILSRGFSYFSVPMFWGIYSLVPTVWVLFLDGKVPIGGSLGICIIALTPLMIWLAYMGFLLYLSCRGYDMKSGRKKEGSSICCSC